MAVTGQPASDRGKEGGTPHSHLPAWDRSAVLWDFGETTTGEPQANKTPVFKLIFSFFLHKHCHSQTTQGLDSHFPRIRPAGNQERCVRAGTVAMPLGRRTQLPFEDTHAQLQERAAYADDSHQARGQVKSA